MAHSFFEYRGRSVRLHDLDIVIALLLFDAALSRRDGRGAQDHLQGVVREWTSRLDAWGPGCIDLELDTILTGSASADALLGLIGQAQEELRMHGDEVPAEYINDRLGPSGNRVLHAVPASSIQRVLEQMASVLAGEAPGTAPTRAGGR
jgi:hypothetical protein